MDWWGVKEEESESVEGGDREFMSDVARLSATRGTRTGGHASEGGGLDHWGGGDRWKHAPE